MHFHRGNSARACETAHHHPVKNGWSWRYIVSLPLKFMERTGTALPLRATANSRWCQQTTALWKLIWNHSNIFMQKRYLILSKFVSIILKKIKSIVANNQIRGTRWSSWLMHCATSRKVASSIPDGVIEFFHWHNPSGRTSALRSIQTLTEISTRNINFG